MNILAMEPYFGGSHEAFLDGWIGRSRHHWTVLTLPARKWKWRMRHAAIDFAREADARLRAGASWDIVVCSDMLDLATFIGLALPPIRDLPTVAYFHENQITYPYRHEAERDFTYAMINITTARAATRVWFNSAFHRTSFLKAAAKLLSRIPDHDPAGIIPDIEAHSRIQPQGVAALPPHRTTRRPGPLRIVWAARWEHDKNPETFFEALTQLARRNVPFTVDVLGEQFRDAPPIFAEARRTLANHIGQWGFLPGRKDYEAALMDADIFVSTAHHEFFGVSAVEAAVAGAFPLLPRRLAYPEVFQADRYPHFFYDGSAGQLAERLAELAGAVARGELRPPEEDLLGQYTWPRLAPRLDDALVEIAAATAGGALRS